MSCLKISRGKQSNGSERIRNEWDVVFNDITCHNIGNCINRYGTSWYRM